MMYSSRILRRKVKGMLRIQCSMKRYTRPNGIDVSTPRELTLTSVFESASACHLRQRFQSEHNSPYHIIADFLDYICPNHDADILESLHVEVCGEYELVEAFAQTSAEGPAGVSNTYTTAT